MGEELVHVVADRVLVAGEFLVGERPGGEVVPARAAGGLRVRRDDLHVVTHEVVPVLEALGIAGAHQEDDRRGVGSGVVRELRLPVLRDLAGLRDDGVDVAGERERDDLRVEAVDHRPRLGAGAAVRALDVEGRVAERLPVRVEGGVVVPVELARRVVGDVEELGLRVGRAGEAGGDERRGGHGGETAPGAAERLGHRADGRAARVEAVQGSEDVEADAGGGPAGSRTSAGAGFVDPGVEHCDLHLLSDYHDRCGRH